MVFWIIAHHQFNGQIETIASYVRRESNAITARFVCEKKLIKSNTIWTVACQRVMRLIG